MTFRKSILLLISLSMIAALVACSSSSTTPPPAITVTLSTVPASLQVGATQAITATVANDSKNGGVTWTVTCGSTGACGSFNPTSTASGASTTYTAPAAVPSGNTVTITATSVSDTSISASTAPITITAAPGITVTLSTVPASLEVDATQAITATVTNDPQNLGVTWTVTCGSAGACGSFNPTSTASGDSTTYTAPIAVPSGSTVTITATSVANSLISANAVVTITPPPGMTVTLSTPPPSSMAPSATANIVAKVGNDPYVADVTWSCTPVNTCGSFSPTQTGSGYATTYTAPATTGNVVITATSVTDYAISASATVTITTAASGTLTPGNYVFSLSGSDANFDLYSVSGVFTLASDGVTITGGEQDFVDYTFEATYDPITGGSVSTPDAAGNLTITLTTDDPCIGPGAGDDTCSGTGTETLVATLVSNSKAVVAEYDTWATSSGTLDLQDSTAAAATPSGGYAFYLSGVDYGDCPLAIGGVINVDGGTSNPGQISGTGSIFDANDCFSGSTYASETFVANDSTVSAPDGLGRVTFTLNPTDPTGQFLQMVLEGYIVDATHIRLVESFDDNFSFTGGTAFAQGSNTGNFSSVSGNSYVVGLAGFDMAGAMQAAGLLTAGATTFSGVINYNDLTGTGIQAPDPVTEGTDTYTVDSTGRVSIPGMTDGVADGASFNLQLYLDGNGHALAITLDDKDVVAGLAYQQTGGGSFTAASFSGTYAMNVSGADWNFEDELDAVGPVAADGIGTFTGSVDLNWIFNTGPTGKLPVSGTFTAAASGVFSSTTAAGSGITGLDVTSCPTGCTDDAFAYYVIDPTKILAIETDPNQLTLGFFLLQQ